MVINLTNYRTVVDDIVNDFMDRYPDKENMRGCVNRALNRAEIGFGDKEVSYLQAEKLAEHLSGSMRMLQPEFNGTYLRKLKSYTLDT